MDRATALADAGHFRQASNVYLEAVLAGCRHPVILTALGNLLLGEGRVREAADAFRFAAAQHPGYLPARSCYLFALNALDGLTPDHVAQEHRALGALYSAPLPAHVPYPHHRRVRLGYVSGKFYRHTGAQFLEPVLRAHDRRQFEVFCYRNNAADDDVTARIATLADHWRDVRHLDDARCAALFRQDEIDILIDTDGHTTENRLGVFALRPAPVQVTWMGYPNTTGLTAIDYRITDSVTDPPIPNTSLHTERLLRIDPVFLPFAPLHDAPSLAPLPALARGFTTFACFNELHKLADSAVACMSQVLQQVPGSRLLLKSRSLRDPAICRDQRQRFADRGIDPERIACRGGIPDRTAYLNLHNEVDLALDTFPYTGTTTTCEALWMGVPVITLEGVTHRERVSSSLLQAAGLPQFIARSPEDYVAIAVAAASNTPALACLRSTLRQRLLHSPLMDVTGFTRRLETALASLTGDPHE